MASTQWLSRNLTFLAKAPTEGTCMREMFPVSAQTEQPNSEAAHPKGFRMETSDTNGKLRLPAVFRYNLQPSKGKQVSEKPLPPGKHLSLSHCRQNSISSIKARSGFLKARKNKQKVSERRAEQTRSHTKPQLTDKLLPRGQDEYFHKTSLKYQFNRN